MENLNGVGIQGRRPDRWKKLNTSQSKDRLVVVIKEWRTRVTRKFTCLCLAFFSLLSFSILSFGQRQTGAVHGSVLDEEKNPLPGVTITISGPALQGTQSYVTTAKGLFRFPALAPGTYSIRAQMPGFRTQVSEGIAVSLGKVTEITIPMKAAAVEEEVTVIAATPTVDTTSSTLTQNYGSEFIASIPINRDLYDIANSAPGAVADEAARKTSSVMGADIHQTQYALDGVNIVDPAASYLTANMNTEIFEEVSFEVGAHMPEAGQTDSAYINVVTKSGGNSFSGSLSSYYMGKSLSVPLWTEEETNIFGLAPVDRYKKSIDVAGTFGGPIIKDKIWFFTSYRYLDWVRTFSPYPDFELSHKENMAFVKLTAQVSPKFKLLGSFHYNVFDEPYRTAAVEWGRLKDNIPTELGNLTDILNLQANWILDANTFTDFRFGHNYRLMPLHSQPGTEDLPRQYDRATDTLFGSNTYNEDYRTHKYLGSVALTRFQEDFLGGAHEIKAGIEAEHTRYELDYWKYDPIRLDWYDYATRNPYYTNPSKREGRILTYPSPREQGQWAAKDYGLRLSAFFQDSFKMKKLVVNFGLRYDNQKQYEPEQHRPYCGLPLLDAIAETYLAPQGLISPWSELTVPAKTMVHFSNFSPRIGLVYDVFGNEKTAVKLSFSRYFEPVWMYKYNYGNILQQAYLTIRWTDTNANKQFDLPPIDTYSVTGYPNQDVTFNYYPDDLKNMYTDEVIIGLDQELGANLRLSLSYVMKRNRNIVEDVDINNGYDPSNPNWIPYDFTDPGMDGRFGTSDDQQFTVYGLSGDAPLKLLRSGNPEGAKRNYNAAVLTLEKRMADKWQLKGSLIYGSYLGNIGAGYDDTDGDSGAFDTPNWFINNYGPLSFDRPLQIKLIGTFVLPYDFILSFYANHASGRPWNRTIQRVYFPSDLDLQQSYVGINAEKPGSRREAGVTNLDLRISKSIMLGSFGRMSLYVDFLNVGMSKKMDVNRDPGGYVYSYQAPPVYTISSVYGQITGVTGEFATRLGLKFTF